MKLFMNMVRGKLVEEVQLRTALARYKADEAVGPALRAALDLIPDHTGQRGSVFDPRSVPGHPSFVRSGWSKHMLYRYVQALERARGGAVLDTCSGLGWGANIVASVARSVDAVDLDEASVEFSSGQWQRENLRFREGNVLALPFADASYDVVLCMESIEHFTKEDGRKYLRELARVCKPGGAIFGSSAFPETRRGATRLCAKNPHHLHIYTRSELIELLEELGWKIDSVTRHYFSAQRS